MASKFLKKLKPSAKPFKKLAKANAQIIKRTVPKQFQKPALRATNVLLNSNVVKTSVETLNAQMSGGDGRAALRRYHFNTFLPFDKRTKDLRDAEVMIASGNPQTRQAGFALRARVDGATARHGRIGAAVGSLFVGGAAGGAVKAAASATRANPTPAEAPFRSVDTWPDPNLVPDVQHQMYSRFPVGSPAWLKTQQPRGGLVSFLWRILVPAEKRVKEPGGSVPGRSGRYGGINPGGTFYYPGGPGGIKRVY